MASPRPTGPAADGGPPRSLPGFAALLPPRLPSAHVAGTGSEFYASRPPTSASLFHQANDLHLPHLPHPHHHHDQGQGYGLHSLRPPVVTATPPPPYGLTTYSSFKPRAVGGHDSPLSAVARTNSPLSALSSITSSLSSMSSTASSTSFVPTQFQPRVHRPLSQQRTRTRTSRYLREVDRRAILQRIQHGEKQADLAKEYQVSRAAISNLKQRRRLKEQQAGRLHGFVRCATDDAADGLEEDEEKDREAEGTEDDERSTGSKTNRRVRRRNSSDVSSSTSESIAYDDGDAQAVAALRHTQHVPPPPSPFSSPSPLADAVAASLSLVQTSSTSHLLLQLQRNDSSFCVAAQRLARLLLEETLGRVPSAEAPTTETSRVVCAVALNDGHGSQLLLDEFRVIEPHCGVGTVRTLSLSPLHETSIVHAPAELTDASVLLLDLVCSETGEEIFAAIEALRTSGVALERLFVVTLVGYASGFGRVRTAFPQLGDILTTSVIHPSSSSGSTAVVGGDADDLVELLRTRLRQIPY